VYGVIADTVRRRTGEIGLPVALGARRRDVVALVFRKALRQQVFEQIERGRPLSGNALRQFSLAEERVAD
jgi:hypothetical protein